MVGGDGKFALIILRGIGNERMGYKISSRGAAEFERDSPAGGYVGETGGRYPSRGGLACAKKERRSTR